MVRDTDDLIRRLTADAAPVQLLASPGRRTLVWLALALAWVGLVVLVESPRADLAARLHDARFLAETAFALAVGLAAARAAFTTVVPGSRSTAVTALAVPLAGWLGAISGGSLQDWMRLGSGATVFATDWGCFPSILVAGALPAVAMAVMLRRGAPLTPVKSMALGGLAAGGVADFGLRLHHHEVGVMVLVWHLAAVAILCGLAGSIGRRVLQWRLLPESVNAVR